MIGELQPHKDFVAPKGKSPKGKDLNKMTNVLRKSQTNNKVELSKYDFSTIYWIYRYSISSSSS